MVMIIIASKNSLNNPYVENKKNSNINSYRQQARRRILVIDDEKDTADVFKFGLELKEFEVDAYTDPFKALSNFKVDYYDAIISDVDMPEMNGFELCKELLKIDDKIKIFFVSAFQSYT